jgi:hypothetical protein
MSDLLDKYRAVLAGCRERADMAEVYTDEEDLDRFSVGYIESVSRESYTLTAVDPEGQLDGRQVGRLDAIVKLVVGSEYLAALKFLHEGKMTLEELRPAAGDIPKDLRGGLEHAMRNRIVVSLLDIDRVATTGFVTDVGHEFVEVHEIRRDGHADGFVILPVDDIFRVDIGGRAEQARHFLHRVRMGL